MREKIISAALESPPASLSHLPTHVEHSRSQDGKDAASFALERDTLLRVQQSFNVVPKFFFLSCLPDYAHENIQRGQSLQGWLNVVPQLL